MGIAPGLIQKGAQAAREWAKALADLSTCKKVQHEKDNADTLMSLIMLETDQCVGEAEFCIELMT
jgi:hypothetical protein